MRSLVGDGFSLVFRAVFLESVLAAPAAIQRLGREQVEIGARHPDLERDGATRIIVVH